MVAVFAIFATLGQLEMKQMGVGLATAILIDATLVRAVLLPATMQLLGEHNWYLPRWLERLPRISWREPWRRRPRRQRVPLKRLARRHDRQPIARQQRGRRRSARLAERRCQSRRLLVPADEQHEAARGAERRERQRHALGRRLGRVADADGAAGRVECRVVREKRRRVSVGADAEQRDIEHDVAELALVGMRRGLRRRARPAPGATWRERRRASRARAAGWIVRRPPARSARRRTRCAPAASRCPTPRAARSSAAASRRRRAPGAPRRAARTPRRRRRRAGRPRRATPLRRLRR